MGHADPNFELTIVLTPSSHPTFTHDPSTTQPELTSLLSSRQPNSDNTKEGEHWNPQPLPPSSAPLSLLSLSPSPPLPLSASFTPSTTTTPTTLCIIFAITITIPRSV